MLQVDKRDNTWCHRFPAPEAERGLWTVLTPLGVSSHSPFTPAPGKVQRASGKCAQVHQRSKYSWTLLTSTTRFTIRLSKPLITYHFQLLLSLCSLLSFSCVILPFSMEAKTSTCTPFNQLLPPRNTKKETYCSSLCHESAPIGLNIQGKVSSSSDKASGAGFLLTPGVNRFHTWISDAPERSTSHTRAWESLQRRGVEEVIGPPPSLPCICFSSNMRRSEHRSVCVRARVRALVFSTYWIIKSSFY